MNATITDHGLQESSAPFSAIGGASVARLEHHVMLSLAPKAVTAPVALEIARLIGGDQALIAAFAIATGTLGSILGPWVLSCVRIDDPVGRAASPWEPLRTATAPR